MLKIFYIGNDKWSSQLIKLYELKAKVKICGALTPSGNHLIKNFCRRRKIPLLIIDNANRAVKSIAKLKPRLIIVTGHQFLLKTPLLSICPAIGFHPSLLPARRGRAPINWAIIDGLTFSGVTTFFLSNKADNGKIIFQQKFMIGNQDTAENLIAKINQILSLMLTKIIERYPQIPTRLQDETKASYTAKRTPKDSEVTLDMPAAVIDRLVRAVTGPYPPAFIKNKFGEKIYLKKISLKPHE